jgi:hypothetical protein
MERTGSIFTFAATDFLRCIQAKPESRLAEAKTLRFPP